MIQFMEVLGFFSSPNCFWLFIAEWQVHIRVGEFNGSCELTVKICKTLVGETIEESGNVKHPGDTWASAGMKLAPCFLSYKGTLK